MIRKSNINIMRMVAISIVLLFLISGFSAMAHGSVPKSSISSNGMSGNIYRGSITPSVQNSTQNNSGGYVKYTLDLINNTLFNGNFVNTNNGIFPFGAAFDSANGYIYVTNQYSGNVSVINGSTNKVIASIGVGSNPYGAAFDSANGYVYVTNFFSGTVSIISTSSQVMKQYSVTFTESGLPSGTTWYVNLTESNGTHYDSGSITGSSYTIKLSNGTYSYTIATMDKTYSPSPSSGTFTVNGASLSESVVFSKVTYLVTFTESGLPSGTTWSVTLNGTTKSSTADTITFSVPNGTYSYSIGAVSGYTVSNSNGSVTVSGKNIPVSITFSSTSPPAKQPSSGIPSIELYGIIGAVVAVAAIGSAVALIRKKRR